MSKVFRDGFYYQFQQLVVFSIGVAEGIHAKHDLDRTREVAQIEERRLAVAAARYQPARYEVARVGVLARVEHRWVVRAVYVGDPRAAAPQRDGWVWIDAFGAKALHLRAPFVVFDRAVGRRLSGGVELRDGSYVTEAISTQPVTVTRPFAVTITPVQLTRGLRR